MAEGKRRGGVPASWSLIGLGLLAVVTLVLVGLAFRHVAPTSAAPSDTGTAAPSPILTPITVPTPVQRVVFLGDGFAAATNGTSWAKLVSEQKGWTATNLAVVGAGYVTVPKTCPEKPCKDFEGMIPQVVAANPTVVVVSGGGSDGDQDLTRVVNRFYKALATGLPEARIIAVSPLWGAPAAPSWLAKHGASIKTAVTAVQGEYHDIGQPLSGKPSLVGADGLPNTEGHQAIAEAVAAQLK